MAVMCSWCGKKLGFTDMNYSYETVGNKQHCICGVCSTKVHSAKNGDVTFDEIKTEETISELFYHLAGQAELTDEMIEERQLRQEQQKIKEEAQQTNPLYDDIHQIAGDLRFIKNFIIFYIVASISVGLIYLFNIL